jgi:hypothetical protein
MVAELHGQDLGVDRGRVDPAAGDQPDGALVKPASTTLAKKPGRAPMRTSAYRVRL